jgi:NAD(P)-dependent dehydrogenase (short-subunit alcohol dehydrogenase family)
MTDDSPRTVLVTGGAHGIGKATVETFARKGHRVIIGDIDLEAALVLANDLNAEGCSVAARELDVSQEESWRSLAHDNLNDPPGIVINNAFYLVVKPAQLLTEEEWDRQLSVSLSAAHRSVRFFGESVAAQAGSIIFVSSVHAFAGWPGHAAYAAAKGGLVAITRQLAVELSPSVRVNCVVPGSIQTRVWDSASSEELVRARDRVPLQRIGEPAEVAAAIAFLASKQASYITGTTLIVDGGLLARGDI